MRMLDEEKDPVVVPAGQVIFSEGDPSGDTMYYVQAGEVEIAIGGRVVGAEGPKGIFGEMSLIDPGSPRSATVRARTEARLVPIDRRRFEYMVAETPYFALTVMKVMADRLRRRDGAG